MQTSEHATRQVAERAAARLRVVDTDGYLACMSEDVEYTLFLDPATVAVAGTSRTKEDLRRGIARVRAVFDYRLLRPGLVRVDGGTASFRLEFDYLHRASGAVLTGFSRLVLHIEGGLIRRVEEYHDRERISAFLMMLGDDAGL